MIGHDDKRVQGELILEAISVDDIKQEPSVRVDLKKATPVGGYCGDEISAAFLWGWDQGRKGKSPGLKADVSGGTIQGPEGPCSLRCRG